jgi:hypothetical protein
MLNILNSKHELSQKLNFKIKHLLKLKVIFQARLPDDIYSNQKSQSGKSFEGFAMEDVGIFIAILSSLCTYT